MRVHRSAQHGSLRVYGAGCSCRPGCPEFLVLGPSPQPEQPSAASEGLPNCARYNTRLGEVCACVGRELKHSTGQRGTKEEPAAVKLVVNNTIRCDREPSGAADKPMPGEETRGQPKARAGRAQLEQAARLPDRTFLPCLPETLACCTSPAVTCLPLRSPSTCAVAHTRPGGFEQRLTAIDLHHPCSSSLAPPLHVQRRPLLVH
jgi:hypothetical protein